MSIKLSPKYGVNPSCSICFFCGESKELLLLGRLPGDKEAPNKQVYNFEPCDNCKEKFKQGFLLIEARAARKDELEIKPGVTVTGNYWLIATEKAIEVLGMENCAQGKCLIDRETATILGLHE